MQIDFSEKAKSEIKDAYIYYFGNGGQELADRFYSEVKSCVKFMGMDNIEIGTFKFRNTKNVRSLNLKKFPYVLFFTRNSQANLVQVIRCLHESRDLENLL